MSIPGEYNKPDIYGPRFRKTFYKIFNKTFFNQLKRKYPELKKYKQVEISALIRNFHKEAVIPEILNSRYGIELPYNLGRVFMGCFDQHCTKTKRTINKKASNDLNKVVKNTNMDTDGKIPFIYYTTWANSIKLMYHHIWGFRPCRELARGMSKVFKENYRNYIVVKRTKLVSKLLR